MHKIGENIKVLRLSRGWTQQQLAEQLHVTRQAVSHYESGRTQPDIDTCRRLAEIFQVELDVVLDGQTPTEQPKLPCWLRWLVFGSMGLFTLAHSVLFWVANKFYFVPNGTVTAEMRPVLQQRLALTGAAQRVESIGYAVFLAVLLAWLIWEVQQPKGLTWKQRLITGVQLLVVGAVASLPWAWLDPYLSAINYFFVVPYNLVRFVCAMVIIWFIQWILKRKETCR